MSEQNVNGTASVAPITGQIVPPPRFTGDAQRDLTILVNYVWDLFAKLQLTDLFVRFTEAFGGTQFNPADLPDPATSTISQAQDTANNAFVLSATNFSTLGFVGSFTVSDTDDEATVSFTTEEASADYKVFVTAQDFTGAAADGAFTVKKVAKTTAGFTVTLAAAPGASTNVTFDFWVRR